jgi:hypothetical protein
MIRLLVLLTILFSTSAFAQVSQFYRSDGTSGMIFGSPNGIQQYYDSRGNTGTIFNNPQSGISQYYFNGPNGMMQDSGTIFNTPRAMPPVPQPAPQIQPMTPVQPLGPALVPPPFGR